MNERVALLVLSCLGFGLALLGALLGGPSLFNLVLAAVAVAGVVASVWLSIKEHYAWQKIPSAVPRYPLRALGTLDQTEYAALLQADVARERLFRARNGVDSSQCGRCHRPVFQTKVRHPIWDGPFDEAGSGKVDVRLFSWCAACDGPPPAQDGPAIRLPYLDHLPIRLLPELFARPVFHALSMPVELYVPPSPAPATDAASTQEPTS